MTPGWVIPSSRFRLLLDAYGLATAYRREVAKAIIANHGPVCS